MIAASRKEEDTVRKFTILIDDGDYHDSETTTMSSLLRDLSAMLVKYLHSDVEPGEGGRWSMVGVLAGTLIIRAAKRGLLDGVEVDFTSDALPLVIKETDR